MSFFRRMTSAHRRNNSLDKIKINGEWLLEEQEIREGIANVFHQLLSEDAGWKADIGRLQFDQISQQEAENLERFFTENEIHAALMEMNGDKAPGLDDFTMALWQSCWDFVKEEILEMFKEFHEHSSFLKSLNNTFLVLIPKKTASGLRINLAKSEIIPVGEVVEIEELAVELGCRVGSLLSQYLGLPLGAPNRAPYMWDGVEERKARESTKGLPVGGGNMEGKIHLVKWEVVCTDKEKGGLGLRKLAMLNKALLGKWIWRYACDKENLWKQVIKVKYGQEGLGWRPKKANGDVGVGVWKEIWKESDWCWDNMIFRVGKGNNIRFWTDVWCIDTALSHCFPHLFGMAVQRSSTIEEMWDQNSGQGGWNLNFLRDFNDWELDMVGDLLHMLRVIGLLWRKIQSFGGKEEMISSGSRKLIAC
ncbi:hypothetical protein CK203_039931 [Vitis vinifera]|uniref:Uncharacterized protein n=1 Tax=Vitis vinifera TaxID=29760 RepID=A0A438I2Z2_VITVI|nr:hypothetical protein CK203_039931 [Vitis vinifera]